MKISELKKYKRILILGFGMEGKATLKFLKKFHPKAHIGVADKTDGPNYLNAQKDYDLVIKTPGIPRRFVQQKYTTATNIFFANVSNTIIGITGSKGKSTTTALTYHIFKKAKLSVFLVGNIGRPMILELLKKHSSKDIFVCELSSYQTEDLMTSPRISVILNLFADHMDYHGSLRNYYRAKKNLVKYTTKKNFFVYNPKYPALKKLALQLPSTNIPFVEKLPFPDHTTPLIGEHNRDNIRASVTIARIFKIPDAVIASAISTFKPLPHRLQNIGTFHGITFYDDAISTTPDSTIAAIHSLKNISTIFLGGFDRGYSFEKLVRELTRANIRNIVLFPETGEKIAACIKKHHTSFPFRILHTRDMKQAVAFAYRHTPKGAICLLSTASPSYSLWKNFEEKGDLFQKEIKRMS